MKFIELMGLMAMILVAPHMSKEFANYLAGICLFVVLVVTVSGR